MAKPQKENGFTPIANEILEQIVKLTLNGTQLRILLVVWRYTYGFSRKSHDLSQTFIADATGISSRHIKSEIGKLIKRNILKVTKEPTNRTPTKLGFNKDYDSWEGGTILPEGNNPSRGEQSFTSRGEQSFTSEGNNPSPLGGNNPSPLGGNNPSPLGGNNPSPKKENIKESIKENIKEAAAIENPVEQIGNLFFELTGRFANGNDFVAISETLKKYSDLEVITKVMKRVTEKKRQKDPSDKIKSFSFFTGAIEDEFKKIEAKKAGESIGRAERDNEEDYDYSNLMYKGTVTYNDDDIDF